VEILDGDEVRRSLSPDLGFSRLEREAHAKRIAYVSLLLSRNGIIAIVALISPFRSSREYARNLIGRFVEVWVSCSAETCRFPGVQDPYEPPMNPEVLIDTEHENPNVCGRKIIAALTDLGYLD